MYKIPLNIGTLAGIAAFALFLLLYYIGFSPVSFGKFIGFWIPIGAIIWANMKVRKENLGGYMTYMQGFLCGMVTMLVWCSFKGFAMYIFMTTIDQHVIDQFISFTHQYMELEEELTGEVSKSRSIMEPYLKTLTPWKLMENDISNNVFYGTFVVSITAFITKKQPKA